MLAVGYDVDIQNSGKIWVNFKNSWGTNWGTNGYFKLGLRDELPIILSDSEKNNSTCQMLQYYDEVAWAVVA